MEDEWRLASTNFSKAQKATCEVKLVLCHKAKTEEETSTFYLLRVKRSNLQNVIHEHLCYDECIIAGNSDTYLISLRFSQPQITSNFEHDTN